MLDIAVYIGDDYREFDLLEDLSMKVSYTTSHERKIRFRNLRHLL